MIVPEEAAVVDGAGAAATHGDSGEAAPQAGGSEAGGAGPAAATPKPPKPALPPMRPHIRRASGGVAAAAAAAVVRGGRGAGSPRALAAADPREAAEAAAAEVRSALDNRDGPPPRIYTERLIASLMAKHPRLSRESPFFQLDAEVTDIIVKMAFAHPYFIRREHEWAAVPPTGGFCLVL